MDKKVTFDIDGVKANWFESFLDYANQIFNINFVLDDFDRYEFPDSPKIKRKVSKNKIDKNWFFIAHVNFTLESKYRNIPVIDGVKKSVEYLISNGWELSAATDRVNSFKRSNIKHYMNKLILKDSKIIEKLENLIVEDTLVWYASNFDPKYFPQKNIMFCNGQSKAESCHGLGSRILIEDDYSNAVKNANFIDPLTQRRNHYSILINMPYNQGSLVENMIRINEPTKEKTYEKVVDLLEKLSKIY